MSDYRRAGEMVRGLTRDDGVLGYNPEQARLLLQVLRTLAGGRPVTGPEIDAIAADLGWAPAAAHAFLRPLTERDSQAPVRLMVSPDGVRSVTPPEAVVSIAIVDPRDTTLGSVETIWTTFCRHIHFFATREEAERWAAGRGDIAILTPDEGYQLGRELTSRFLAQAG